MGYGKGVDTIDSSIVKETIKSLSL